MVTEWVRHWSRMGDRCVGRADGELEVKQFDRACDSYLSATDCYWLALSRADRGVPERRVLADAHVSAFRAALPLLTHPATLFELAVEGTRVTGYVFRPADSGELCRPVVWPVERGATAESSYRQVALAMVRANLACAVYAVDHCEQRRAGPGRPSPMDTLQRAVVQWVRQRPGVDPDIEPLLAPTNP